MDNLFRYEGSEDGIQGVEACLANDEAAHDRRMADSVLMAQHELIIDLKQEVSAAMLRADSSLPNLHI